MTTLVTLYASRTSRLSFEFTSRSSRASYKSTVVARASHAVARSVRPTVAGLVVVLPAGERRNGVDERQTTP